MLYTALEFYEQYPSNILALRGIRRTALAPDLIRELEYHGNKQSEILRAAQVYVLDEAAQLMLQGLSVKMTQGGLDDMFSRVRLPFPAMLLTVPEPSGGMWPSGLVTQHEEMLFTQVFYESNEGFLPNLLVFKSQGAKVEALLTPTLKLSKAIGEGVTEDMAIEQEQTLCASFLRIVVGMSILLQHKAMLETEAVSAFSRAERRRAQKSGQPLPDMRVVKVRLGELGKRQLQAMQAEANEGLTEKTPRRAHWVQGHFMRNRAGSISWRSPHVRGAGSVVPQERQISVARNTCE